MALEGVVVGPRRLEYDPNNSELGQPGDQPGPPGASIEEPAGSAGRVEVDVERVLRDVHADRLRDRVRHLFQVLCLSSGPRRPGIRSGHQEKRGAITLWRGPQRSAKSRPVPSHCRRVRDSSSVAHLLPTGRQRHKTSQRRLPPIWTAISSRCHCELGRGRRRRSSRAKMGPNFATHRRTLS
jgi:hypothetical protein